MHTNVYKMYFGVIKLLLLYVEDDDFSCEIRPFGSMHYGIVDFKMVSDIYVEYTFEIICTLCDFGEYRNSLAESMHSSAPSHK